MLIKESARERESEKQRELSEAIQTLRQLFSVC